MLKSAIHELFRLADSGLSNDEKRSASVDLMKSAWDALRDYDGSCRHDDQILWPGKANGTFGLNPRRLRVKLADFRATWECDTCASLSAHNIRGICPRNRCPGNLSRADYARLEENHYRILYESTDLPPVLHAEEHTAQIESNEAHHRQDRFKNGETHLLSLNYS